jgi:hypothetical protein
MAGRNANIYFPETTYNKLKQVAGDKISRFVSEAVEEKLNRNREQFCQQLAKDYREAAQDSELNQELTS